MSTKLLPVLALAALAATAGPAAAGDEGPYAALGVGLALADDARISGHSDASGAVARPLDATASVDNGWALTGALGWAFPGGLRAEGELGYRANDIPAMNVREPGSLVALLPPGAPPAAAALLKGRQTIDSKVTALTMMANLYYDIEIGGDVVPYVGGGIGLARIAVEASSSDGRRLADDDDLVHAWQLGGGIAYSFGETSGRPVMVTLDWRYYATGDPTFTGALTGTDFDTEQNGHILAIGLRFGL